VDVSWGAYAPRARVELGFQLLKRASLLTQPLSPVTSLPCLATMPAGVRVTVLRCKQSCS